MKRMPLDDRGIAISATFTAEALQPGLAFWMGEMGLDYAIRFAGYNTLFQQLLDGGGLFARNRDGINVALVRCDDWSAAGVDEEIRHLADAVRVAAAYPAPLILVVCPPSAKLRQGMETRLAALREAIAGLPGVSLVAPGDIDALYPVGDPHDPHGDELGHLPYTPEFFAALSTVIARKIHALVTPPFKVIALDCDETLWAGICGEDTPQGVVLDQPRRALQEFMAARRSEGMLLALCSKNNEEDVSETFRAHPEMPLRWEDFAAVRINWESKASNLRSLAAELDLGLDSFILVDDNPKECTETRAGAPGIAALPLPADPGRIPAFLAHVWAFDRARVTTEDRRRPELYAQRAERSRAARSAGSLEEFLQSLDLRIEIAPMTPAQAPRVAQLTERTSQMNATLVRRNEPEIRALISNGAECLAVKVADRFGDYGLVGVLIFRAAGPALRVDTFLLSCRALGRGVEHRMVASLGAIAAGRGLQRVEIPFVAGHRNRPASLFLLSLGSPDPDGVFHFAAAGAAAAVYKPGERVEAPAASEAAERPSVRRDIDYARIASDLRDPAAILERIRARTRPAPAASTQYVAPRTPLERELAALWAGLLNLPAVGIHDNFFEIGGHSLLAVQLLSRVRQIHGVELSLEVVYSGDFTVAELAKAIELKEIEQGGAGFQELLAEIGGLSDDEARQLLAEEQGHS